MSMFPLKLEKSCMAFKLKDETVLLIHEDDIKAIADSVFMECMMNINNPNLVIRNQVDLNLERVKKIQEILSSSKDINVEVRQSYYKQMLVLLSEKGEITNDDKRLYEKKI